MHGVELAAQSIRYGSAHAQDFLVKLRRFCKRMAWVHSRKNPRVKIRSGPFDQQHRNRTQTQEPPIRKSEQSRGDVPTRVTLGHDEIRFDSRGAPNDRLVHRTVPLRGHGNLDAVEPGPRGNPPEPLQHLSALLLLRRRQETPGAAQYVGTTRRLEDMKELEVCAEGTRQLNGLRYRR